MEYAGEAVQDKLAKVNVSGDGNALAFGREVERHALLLVLFKSLVYFRQIRASAVFRYSLSILPCRIFFAHSTAPPTRVYHFTMQIRGSMLDAGADVFVSGLLDEVLRSGRGGCFLPSLHDCYSVSSVATRNLQGALHLLGGKY